MRRSKAGKRTEYWRLYRRAFAWVLASARRPFLLTVGAQVVGAVALAVGLLAGGSVVERLTSATNETSLGSFLPAVAVLALCLTVSGLSLVATREMRLLVGELVAVHLQEQIIDVAGSVDYEQFERQDFHDLLGRATSQGAQSSLQIVYEVVAVVSAVATSVAMVVVVAASVPQILPALVLIALPFLFAARISAQLAFRTIYELTASDRLRSYLYRALTGKSEARELRVFDLQHVLSERWRDLYRLRIERLRRLVSKRMMLNAIATVAGTALVAGVLLIIVQAALDEQISIGDAAVAIVALQQLSGRVRGASTSAGSLRQSALFLDDFQKFQALYQERTLYEQPSAVSPLTKLRVENVSFHYPGTDVTVLDDVSLEIGRGEVVALVGVSGSGKSTLAHLVAGLYRPTEGRITWDGENIADAPRHGYWRSLAVVFQDFSRYELTARENVGLSDHTRIHDLDAARDAARRAGIDDAIAKLPAGYDSMLSRAYDSGVDLSVGQWQRIAVARAFFREASLIVLDEPAAALDPLAEQALYGRLEELCTTRSVLLISHRFSTVRLAHRIYVMREGRIVEHGTHRELLDLEGHYAQLFRAQAAGFVDAV